MYLERLEIAGFKSFAPKTVLVFPRPENGSSFGITAVVGPNGSGKSNIVESIRWGLGEQSLKSLRGKKAEDVIFSGTDKKARLSVAEASLHFNNEDNGAPIDYRQFTITRKIYRHGESEYLINKNRVRLQDILVLLAQSNFGQKSYSIISQGMIDAILHSSSAERKNFFDEATGVRQYQIKKEEALRKLEKTRTNLGQTEIALQEIEPRMRSLTRQIKKLEQRQKFEENLQELQKNYYGHLWQKINHRLIEINEKILGSEKKNDLIEKSINHLQKQLESMAFEKISDDYQKLQTEQQELIDVKNEYLEKISVLRGKLIIKQERLKANIKPKEFNQQKVINDLNEIKSLYDNLSKNFTAAPTLSDIEIIKQEASAISQKINALVCYLSGEKEEIAVNSNSSNLEQEIKNLDQEVKELNQQIQLAGEKLTDFTLKEQEKRKSLFDLQKKTQAQQNEYHTINNELNNLKIEKARIETHKEDLEEEIKRETSFHNLEELAKTTLPDGEAESLYPEIQKLKSQLELIGGIDPEIAKEYPECKERWEFLTTQTEDLKHALGSLNKIIKQLDDQIEHRFNQTFHQINEKFDYYFKVFFGGGKAKLTLQKFFNNAATAQISEISGEQETEESKNEKEAQPAQEKLEEISDIEIMANPPRKKIKNIEALSGGERTLTSLSLIFAIIAINKPPFVVLDEVDAALDEENSTRFANIIKDLDKKTQFIIITHNRQTMEAANTLYGVTMNKDGVSQLLSMKL